MHIETTGLRSIPPANESGVLFEGDRLPLEGLAVAEAKALLADTWAIPYFSDAIVNGCPVSVNSVLLPVDSLAFRRRFGFKGGNDQDGNKIEAESLVRAYPELLDIAATVKALDLPAGRSLDVMVGLVARWAEERFGQPGRQIMAILKDIVERLERIEAPRIPMKQKELDILEALEEGQMVGEKLALKAGYEYDGHFKGTLASMVKRKVIGNKKPGGYFLPRTPKS
jgi:hypothetical protein